ncbi:MCP four helix bundle domain-containing protein [Undibacterium sp. RTI2.1]|uniref:MCP four helix bundle domain-containing protein n=1 Tax=unclassified Undibacterium TaxID=2630295 RepID=UPI002AB3BD17|nr:MULTISPECIES: MCP four helix bundle domain-containing protein [unclassified Undibacterium]MDY7539766.1 MCP four helix bundle domain-containing protein [Undibacterium sp. 5I1]MEB0029448.1 MCP four helix bundle domain-containing protein [Undibacterium sp. RTI2.1]MEB0115933.1 MCP four helix bundle domain-containing protein [Undibacterium sp. RTI2.2]MEB0232431.1 MCP four helix bundle domain-containing protein [Undibacterium sp. 10I3]MEB0256801.1 MCP four helix bundle domain-containing protein [
MKLFYNLRIASKLYVGFVLLLVLTSFLGIFAVIQLARVNSATYELGTNWMPSVNAAMGIKERMSRLRTQEMQIVLSSGDAKNIDFYSKRWNTYFDELKSYEDKYVKLMTTEDEKKKYAEYLTLWEKYKVETKK